MKPERLYPILYDLSTAIGSEVSEQPLMKRIMQRLMFHTGLPAALWLVRRNESWSIRTAIGVSMDERSGEVWSGSASSCWFTDTERLRLLGAGDDWRSALALKVDEHTFILLLSRREPDTSLPWTRALMPVMGNLHNALHLCRLNDMQTRRLTQEVEQGYRELHASEGRFFALVQQAPISIQIFRSDGTCLMVNPAWEKLWSARFADLDEYNVLHDEQLIENGQIMGIRRAFAGEQVFIDAHLYTLIHDQGTDGSERSLWLRANLFPLKNDAGQVTHVVVIHEDITWWKEADDRLRKSEQRYRSLVEVIPDGVGICRDGRWLMVNPAMLAAFGADSAGELIGSSVEDRVHPDDRDIMPPACFGTEEEAEEKLRLLRLIRMDGSEFWAEAQSQMIDDADGEPAVLLVIRDVTERVNAERENSLLRAAIDQSSEPMMLLDTDGRILLANPTSGQLYGLKSNEMTGLQFRELPGGRLEDGLYSEIRATILQGRTWDGEFIITTNRQQRLIARRISPVYDKKGDVRWLVVDRDISEERQRQEKMAHVQRLESLGVLAGGIAHDFNNLLGVIMGNVSLARSEITPAETVSESLKNIEEASHRAANLCKQMLAYSGKGKFVVQPVNLSELVENMAQLLEISINKNVNMRYEMASHLPSIKADVAQLQQVIMNLVINANEAIGDENGTLVVTTGQMDIDADYLESTYVGDCDLKSGPYVWLEVSDTGCGMDKETQERLFEPFFTTKFTGRGLGMSAILGIIRGHGGAIKVYSEKGKGTTIKVLFPVVGQKAISLAAEREAIAAVREDGGTVLVVDDEEMLRNVAANMLKAGGYEVIMAEDGVDALARLKEYRDEIDCVLLDMKMPRMGGEEAFTEMRRIKPDIKVLLSSGYNEQTATNRFAGKGLAGFIQKPYNLKKLLTAVAEMLGR